MKFAFLYDRERKLFAIGYQPGTRVLDGSYYDLLASESRLASFVAIANAITIRRPLSAPWISPGLRHKSSCMSCR